MIALYYTGYKDKKYYRYKDIIVVTKKSFEE